MRFSSSWRKPLQPLPWRAQLSSRHCHPDGQPRPERGVRPSSTHPPPQGLLSAGWEQVGAQAAALTARPPATSCDYWLRPRPVPQGRSRGGHRWHGAEATPGLVSTLPPAGPPLGRVIRAHPRRPPTKTGSSGTRSFAFLPLSQPDCSPQGDAIRLCHPHSPLPRPCQAPPTPRPPVQAREPREGAFLQSTGRQGLTATTYANDRDLALAFQGKPRGLSAAVVGVALATAPWKHVQPAE